MKFASPMLAVLIGACLPLASLAQSTAPAGGGQLPASYDDAKARADSDEAAMPPDQRASLISAQSALLDQAIPGCRTAAPDLSPFVVVVQLDAQGNIGKSWRKGSSPLSICVQKALQGKQLPAPAQAPFLTSFELSFSP